MAEPIGVSVFAQALQRLPAVRGGGADAPSTAPSADGGGGAAGAGAAAAAGTNGGPLLTREWLVLCRTVIPVIEQLGAGFIIVRGDISGNIEVTISPSFAAHTAVCGFEFAAAAFLYY